MWSGLTYCYPPVFIDYRDRCRFYQFSQYVVEKFGCREKGMGTPISAKAYWQSDLAENRDSLLPFYGLFLA
ncbi:MAG: hypothetical protein A2505_10060 [Deltaproteobacteria bacterium RIFOXYD12_FULL_55_16]|nr:MAG: hypothetical protein A2505_10060 [Deltaproteobacteria bacterium RIFOXYD12_FULL_55_16]